MKRSEIRTFVQTGANAITPAVTFGTGTYTFFNSNRDWSYANGLVFHETVTSMEVDTETFAAQAPTDGWNVKLWIAFLTKMDAIPDDYEPLIDQADYIAQRLMYKYNQVVSGYKRVTITDVKRVPFVKKNADVLCGVTLSFKINAPDQTNVC